MHPLPVLNKRNVRALWFSVFIFLLLLYLIAICLTFPIPYPFWTLVILTVLFFGVPYSIKKFAYKVWPKVSSRVSKFGKKYTLRVIYSIVLPLIRLAGTNLTVQKTTMATLWQNWEQKNQQVISKQSGNHWLVHYITWAYRSRNLWALFLLPFITILRNLEESPDDQPPEALLLYTLY
ncbi:MAG: hypothetical protein A3C06_02875 [Candidatus Taylorbacteria bacterium RIFCSPHIGHO2_02_FULL_46_13]|uniref:Uncharacterized protein n=1 Tax=Candidatus Taylorbacteria bacterium RIFCSPHIGHO2_02_FULL_46_13 TaxID=1802312 RepID=A0A1G2MRJ9_9BACT|nr:MAG: hypothetical protein A3C06_02875 [Candidatus Taylorbacteria bacterium RIFCSPHIGHO2_02_FULL_46_13]